MKYDFSEDNMNSCPLFRSSPLREEQSFYRRCDERRRKEPVVQLMAGVANWSLGLSLIFVYTLCIYCIT